METFLNTMSPTRLEVRWPVSFSIRCLEYSGKAAERGSGLRHHVAHESNHDDREYENGQITVESREVPQAHSSIDHKAPAEYENGENGDVVAEHNDRNQRGKISEGC
jgi:hypothetical protein